MNKTGVQIGENIIRVIVEKKQGKKWRIIHNETETIPEGIVKNGQIIEPEKLGLAIKELFLKKNIRETHVAVFLEEAPFFIRHFDIPKVNKNELASAIQFRAQTELPVNPEDLVIRFFPLQKQEVKKKETVHGEYVVVAMDKALVNKIADAIHNAGLTLSALTLEPIAIYQGLVGDEELKGELQGNFLLIRTDTSRMMLAIFSNGRLVHSRYLPFSTGKQDWEQEISRTLMSWNSSEGHEHVEQIIVFGAKEHEEAIRKHIEEIMNISILHQEDPSIPCRGLTLKKDVDIKFYVDKVAFKLLKKTPIYVYALVIITGFMFFSLLYQYGSQAYVRANISRLQNNISERAEIQGLLQKQKKLEETRTSVLKSEREVLTQHIDPISTYQQIAPPTPGIIRFTQFMFDNQIIRVVGRTGDSQNLINYYLHLQQNPNLTNVKMINGSGGTGGMEFSFEMNRKGTPVK